MQFETDYETGGSGRFFSLGLSHETLENHYKTNFRMMHSYKYSLSELNEMIPWEREVYIILLLNHLTILYY